MKNMLFLQDNQNLCRCFKEYADWVHNNYLYNSVDPFVVEIGSNDGAMLENFAKKKYKASGY